jgi:hypothetical protein
MSYSNGPMSYSWFGKGWVDGVYIINTVLRVITMSVLATLNRCVHFRQPNYKSVERAEVVDRIDVVDPDRLRTEVLLLPVGTRPSLPDDRDTRIGDTWRCDIGLNAGLTSPMPLRADDEAESDDRGLDPTGMPPSVSRRSFPVPEPTCIVDNDSSSVEDSSSSRTSSASAYLRSRHSGYVSKHEIPRAKGNLSSKRKTS